MSKLLWNACVLFLIAGVLCLSGCELAQAVGTVFGIVRPEPAALVAARAVDEAVLSWISQLWHVGTPIAATAAVVDGMHTGSVLRVPVTKKARAVSAAKKQVKAAQKQIVAEVVEAKRAAAARAPTPKVG